MSRWPDGQNPWSGLDLDLISQPGNFKQRFGEADPSRVADFDQLRSNHHQPRRRNHIVGTPTLLCVLLARTNAPDQKRAWGHPLHTPARMAPCHSTPRRLRVPQRDHRQAEARLEGLHWRSCVIGRAYREGRLLDGAL
jgi:hypothetical protein